MTEAIAEAKAFCNSLGQPCHKVKRVAEALAEPVASEKRDANGRRWCCFYGEACLKEKREADPIADAEAFCNSPGQPCHKVKRVAEALAEPVASGKRDAKCHQGCWSYGEASLKEKREADPIPRFQGHYGCWLPGEACIKVKRQLEDFEVVNLSEWIL